MFKVIIKNGTGITYDAYVKAIGGVTTKRRITVRKRALSIFGIYQDGNYTGKWYFSLDHAIEMARETALTHGDFYDGVEAEV